MNWIGGTYYNGTQFMLNLDNIAMMIPDSRADYTRVVTGGGVSCYLNIEYDTLQELIAEIYRKEHKEEEKENV